MVWYSIIYSICVGVFFAGLVLTILLLILSSANLYQTLNSDFEVDVDSDIDLGSDLELDSDFEVNLDSDLELDISAPDEIDIAESSTVNSDLSNELNGETNIDMGIGISTLGGNLEDVVYHSRAPLSLIFSLFLLWFGATGLILYNFIALKGVWILLTSLIPFGIVKLIAKYWGKFAQNKQLRIFSGKQLIGEKAVVKIDVSDEGGIISIMTRNGIQQQHAKTLFPLSYFYAGDNVFIVDYKNGIYYVDTTRENIVHHDEINSKIAGENLNTLNHGRSNSKL